MAAPDPFELLEQVVDQTSFLAFLEALEADFRTGASNWQNDRVDTVIEAAAAWGRATGAHWHATGDGNVWRRCAEILYCGKIYE
ncbi:hypothetical protein P1X14_09765 [Sphingomonas sp. AOB5]|uniref:DUF7660 family protein n=1 Tax=Sphingomonas sp. AOB5 TaxID=3034017 RepID=UPI0023FA267E|nr:hypothetical protein [Sphingomonas sp. AOB5]MDF7775532.1 hypothetical protein [Sphingomonas sp. AOB5]